MIQQIQSTDDRLPAYVRLRDTLAARIASGEWGTDQPIPAETSLARDYGISVGTVRKAVDGLVEEGLLERRQGSGTYVRRPSFDATLFRFFQIRDVGGGPSTIPSSRLLSRALTKAPAEAAAALGTKEVIKIVRVRSLSEQPILYEEIYISSHLFAGFESLPQDELGPLLYPIYFDSFGVLVKSATDDLSFDTATREVASKLGIAHRDPIAVIRRTARGIDGKAVEWRIARGSAARFNYRSEIH